MIIFNEEINFTPDQEEKLKQYFDEDWFKELNDQVIIYDENAPIAQKLEHVLNYIYYYERSYKDLIRTVANFFDLLELYKEKKPMDFRRNALGAIELYQSGFNSGNGFYTGKFKHPGMMSSTGHFLSGVFLTTDRTVYIKKHTMDLNDRNTRSQYKAQSKYNASLAQQVFSYFGEKSAKYLPAIEKYPYCYVISENFINPNQEMITLDNFYSEEDSTECRKHSQVIKIIESNLKVRYKNRMSEEEYSKLIANIKLQYAKQAFIKRIIGLGDERLCNIGIILTESEEEGKLPKINMSPAFDLDVSFNYADELKMECLCADNDKFDIESLMQEFSRIDGFKEFIHKVFDNIKDENLAIQTILDNAYQETQATFFIKDEQRKNYEDYLRNIFTQIKEAYHKLTINSEKEAEDVQTILD